MTLHWGLPRGGKPLYVPITHKLMRSKVRRSGLWTANLMIFLKNAALFAKFLTPIVLNNTKIRPPRYLIVAAFVVFQSQKDRFLH